MCGEMAGEDLYSLVLIALGFDELSMNATSISRVKRVIRQVKYSEVQAILENLLVLATAEDVASALERKCASVIRRCSQNDICDALVRRSMVSTRQWHGFERLDRLHGKRLMFRF